MNRLLATFLTSVCLWIPAAAVPVITTGPGTNLNGNGAEHTIGQVFIPTGPETVLDSFEFDLIPTGALYTFRAYVQQFDVTLGKPVNSILFTSGSTAFSGSVGQFQTFVFSTGGIQLTANTTYIAYVSTLEEPTTPGFPVARVVIPATASPNLESNRRNSTASTFDPDWTGSVFTTGSQMEFIANFSAAAVANVPEVSSQGAAVPLVLLFSLLVLLKDRRRLSAS
jgi:hypothetical protein